ncbi:MAG TPA: TrpB-like pyridoxal phosphate-dependent enzyme [Nitrospinae bacterium]|nr:TrpB-like pyridoxal phosphate-dependent enzyme [Nitrospinota bacterium]HBA27736.1 TrpB-like pyridoxal phosphate-dependent enzyme [Nitrospinota bacterium]
MNETKVVLSERDLPKKWYNILPDMPSAPPPPIHPGTKKPLGPEDLSPIFPMNLIEQEMSPKNWITIPEDILNIYALWRPTPLYRAHRLEKALNTPAKIYYKYEGVSPAGSHKPNTSVAQAYYNKVAGTKRIATETGAGQWGSAISMACKMFDLQCTVYMVRVSYNQKPYRRSMMETWGAEVHSSPSRITQAGKKILEVNPDSPGSLGMAISEAVEDAATHDDTKYSLGSVLNHVLLHQTVIGLELKKQFEKLGEKPDILIACCGGGSNFGGFTFPFIKDKLNGENIRFIAVEPAACPTLTKGEYKYDFGDTAQLTPLVKMYTLGHDFVPPGIHAGGLRYHGDSPLVSQLLHEGVIEAVAYKQNPVFGAAVLFSKSEGIIPAPESAHAIKAAVDEAIKCRESKEQKVIAFNLSGHGNFDMSAYDSYLSEKLEDFEMPEEEIKRALARLPKVE